MTNDGNHNLINNTTRTHSRDLCVDFTSDCENIPGNRRYLLMSLVTLWVGLGLSFVVAVVSMRVAATTYDAGAIAEAREKERMKEKAASASAATAPFGV